MTIQHWLPADVRGDILAAALRSDAAAPLVVHVRPEVHARMGSGPLSADPTGQGTCIPVVVDDELPRAPGYEVHRVPPASSSPPLRPAARDRGGPGRGRRLGGGRPVHRPVVDRRDPPPRPVPGTALAAGPPRAPPAPAGLRPSAGAPTVAVRAGPLGAWPAPRGSGRGPADAEERHRGGPDLGQRRPAEGRRLAGPDRAHRRLEGAGRRAADGAPAQHRRRRPGRPRRPRRRAAGRARLPARVLPALAASTSAATTSRYGQFGENFTVDGLPDDEVCIGDRYRIGEAEFEVTQPRVTCYRVGHAPRRARACPALLVAHHRPGFYLRVHPRGPVRAGDDDRPDPPTGPHALSVAEIDALLYLPGRDPVQLARRAAIPALSPGWQASFRELLAAARPPATRARPPPARAGVARVPSAPGDRGRSGEPTSSSVHLAAADGGPLPPAARRASS